MHLGPGLTLLVVSATVRFLSSKGHKIEYVAKLNNRKSIEEKESGIIIPRIIKKETWGRMKRHPVKFNSVIIEDNKEDYIF